MINAFKRLLFVITIVLFYLVAVIGFFLLLTIVTPLWWILTGKMGLIEKYFDWSDKKVDEIKELLDVD